MSGVGGRRAPHLPGLATVIGVQLLFAVGLLIWAASDSRLGQLALAAAVLIATAFIPLGTHRSVAATTARHVGFRWARLRRRSTDPTPAPFDIPISQQPMRAAHPVHDGFIGTRWSGGTLITMLRVFPDDPAPTYFTPAGAVPEPGNGQLLPLPTLAACIDPFDIRLASIDVIAQGNRIAGAGPVAGAYAGTLGPLPATAQRAVYVVLRLDPTNCPDAVARRGGGALGAMRTATITTRRVARRLTETGLRAVALSASEMTATTTALTGGSPLEEIHEEWTGLRCGHIRMRTAAIEPAHLQRILATVWTNHALSTTVALRLAHGPDDTLWLGGLLRVDEHPESGRTLSEWPDGLLPLDGRHFDALTATLPIGTAPHLFRQLPTVSGTAAHDLLAAVEFPSAGCGQLIGADRMGRAVTAPLFSPGVTDVVIHGSHRLAALTVLRAIATGAHVVVHTPRPDRWSPLVASIADPRLLTMSTQDPTAGTTGRIEVFDGIPPRPVPAGTTCFMITDTEAYGGSVDAQIVLTQNPHAPQDISVRWPTGTLRVTMVATEEEWSLIATERYDRRRPPADQITPAAGTNAR
ncbi:MAG: type VII secretion protein EccE [Gordonia sp. (in: high G+C Gram-positive bacteria)]